MYELPLDKMTVAEKLHAMDVLWADLSRDDRLESPAWHADVLKERDERIKSGKETFLDWEEAKHSLREMLR